MKLLKYFLLPFAAVAICSCSKSHPPLDVAANFDAQKYQGEWHEIARLPNRFERGLVAAKATYQLQKDGRLTVLNQGLRSNGDMTSIRGAAAAVAPAKLKVRFNPFPASLFAGDYWVLFVNDAHTHAIVGAPNRNYLWLLSKDASATQDDFKEPLRKVQDDGFNLETLVLNPRRIP